MLRVNGARKYFRPDSLTLSALFRLAWAFVVCQRSPNVGRFAPHFGLIFAPLRCRSNFPPSLSSQNMRRYSNTVSGPLMTPIVAIESSLENIECTVISQACKRFTEEHVRRLVVSEQEIWRAWRHYLASPSSGLGPDFPILSEEPSSCFPMRTHASGLILSTGRSTRQSLLIFCGRYLCRTGWYLRASVLLPNWLFKRSFNFVYGQAPAKMFASRVLNECRNTLSFPNIKEKCEAFEQKDCPKIV